MEADFGFVLFGTKRRRGIDEERIMDY